MIKSLWLLLLLPSAIFAQTKYAAIERVAIPLMKYVMAVKDYPFRDHGLFPDHLIVPTIEDKLKGNDPELEFAKKLIQQ
jgi:hypothetical protein